MPPLFPILSWSKVSTEVDEQSDTSSGPRPLQIYALATCSQYLSLSGEHRKICGHAGVVAIGGQSKCLLCVIEGFSLLCQAEVQRCDVAELIGGLLHGGKHGPVVGCDSDVDLSGG